MLGDQRASRALVDVNEPSRRLSVAKGTLCKWVYLPHCMSASPSHPEAAPTDLKAGAVSKVLSLAEAAAFVRCSRAHLRTSSSKVPGVPHQPIVRIGRRVLFRRESLEGRKVGLNSFGDLDGFRYN